MRDFQQSLIYRRRWRYVVVGVLIGCLVGIVVSLFRWLIGWSLEQIVTIYHAMQQQPMYLLLFIPITVVMGYGLGLIVKSDPHIKGSGIPQVELQIQGHLKMNWWSVLWKKFIAGFISIGSGLFLGREGPSIQLGSAIGHGVARSFKSNRVQENVFISSGAGAGLAAAFNAPIAGLMFVLEEVHHTFSPTVALTTLTATITANFVSLQFFGNKPALDLGNDIQFPIYYYGYLVGLGIVLALFGWCYQQVTFALPQLYRRFLPMVPTYFYGIFAGLLIIPVGMVAPHLLGGGGELILELVESYPTATFLLGLLIIRFVYSMISYGTGLPGGIFLPILSLGAVVGGVYGRIIMDAANIPTEYFICFIFFAMAGCFAAIGKAPLTALLLVSEMVGGLNQLMPLGIVVLTAYLMAEFLHMPPIYEALAERMIQHHDSQKTGKRTIFEVPIVVESPLVDRYIKEIKWPEDILIATVRRGEKELITKGSVKLQPGDILIVVTDEGIVGHMNEVMAHLVNPTVET